jgi:hypothetical protein
LATEADKQTQMTIVQPVTEALEFGAEGLISGDACFFEVLPMDKAVFEALPKSIF